MGHWLANGGGAPKLESHSIDVTCGCSGAEGPSMLEGVVKGIWCKWSPESLAISTFLHFCWTWPVSGSELAEL